MVKKVLTDFRNSSAPSGSGRRPQPMGVALTLRCGSQIRSACPVWLEADGRWSESHNRHVMVGTHVAADRATVQPIRASLGGQAEVDAVHFQQSLDLN